MVRFVLVPLPAHGHAAPMSALAQGLRAAGVAVTVAVNAEFAAPFTAAGVDVALIDATVRRHIPDRKSARQFAREVGEIRRLRQSMKRSVDQVVRLLAGDPGTILVADIGARWAIEAADRTGTPFAVLFASHAFNEELFIFEVGKRMGHRAAGVARRLRLGPRLIPAIRSVPPRAEVGLVNSIAELQPEPQMFREGYRMVGPLRKTDDHHEPVELPWRQGERLLYVSTGTFFTRGEEFFRKVVRAFADSSWNVVLATAHTDPAALGALPGNVVAHRYVPQLSVLERSAVFITHGGINSVFESIAARVPMVLVPRSQEQVTNARGIADQGAGVAIEVTADAERIRRAVEQVHADPAVAANVAALADRIEHRELGPAAAVKALLEVAARLDFGHGPRVQCPAPEVR
ncbi:nucleotide disphospho-sugar-binding domain-containing protein [Actinosynnema sp. NPDC059797]